MGKTAKAACWESCIVAQLVSHYPECEVCGYVACWVLGPESYKGADS